MKVVVPLIAFVIGIIVGVFSLQLLSARSYHRNVPAPSSSAIERPMRELSIDPASIRAGDPVVHGTTFSRTSGGSTQGGVWSCQGPAVIEFQFPADEWLYVLEGSVGVDYLGQKFTLEPGDSALFRAGTMASWDIPDMVKKAWVQHEPGSAIRRYSWLF